MDSRKATKIYKKWSDAEEAELNRLKLEAIVIANNVFGRLKTKYEPNESNS